MKKEMEFNHDAKSLADALGVDSHEFAKQLATVIAISKANDEDKISRISQLIHACVDYKIILMMATTQLVVIVDKFDSTSDIDDLLNNFSNN